MTKETKSVVVLGYGPQPLDFFSRAMKSTGSDAVLDQDLARMAGATIAVGTPSALKIIKDRLNQGALLAVQQEHKGLSQAAAVWLASGERGISSNAMFSHLTGIDASGFAGFDPPQDPADFRRCRLLTEQVPEVGMLLQNMETVSPAWKVLVESWDAICAAMDDECPEWRSSGPKRSAPRTYQLIKKAIS